MVLDNGLNVVVDEVHTAPLASVWCWYKVGSKDEVTGLTGVSHWVEHMNFKGTTNIPRDQVKGIIEKFGGSWNGYTWIDQTTYMETASTAGLDRMLFIEAERMANCLYDPEDCESERTVIISELAGKRKRSRHAARAGSDRGRVQGSSVSPSHDRLALRSPDDDARRSVSVLPPQLRSEQRDGGRRRETSIPPTCCAVSRRSSARSRQDAAPRRVKVVEPEQLGERRIEVAREGTTAYLKLAYHAPAVSDADFFPMLVLDAILTGAKGINLWSSFRTPPPQRSARLYRALVERRLASSVGAGLLPTEHPFLYLISATAMEGVSLADVESAATTALDEVARNGITDRELVKAKNQLRARLVFENDSVTNLAHQLGYFQTVAGLDVFHDAPDRIAAVTQEQVESVAQKIFPIRSADGRLVHANGWSARMTTAVQKGLAASRHTVDNGVVVISKQAHTVPAVTIQVGVGAGSIYDPNALVGLSHLASRVLDRGTLTHTTRRDCRSARRAGRVADRRRESPRADRQLHVPVRGLRSDARARRRHRDAAGVSRRRKSTRAKARF